MKSRKSSSGLKTAQSNHRQTGLSDMTQKEYKQNLDVNTRDRELKIEDVKQLRRGLSAKQVRTILYILESEEDFTKMAARLRVAKLARSGTSSFAEWIIEKDIEGTIPKEWDILKDMVTAYCTSEDVSSVVMYRDESIADFLSRIYDKTILLKIEEKELWDNIRHRWFPERYQSLIYGHSGTLPELIEKVRFFDEAISKRRSVRRNSDFREVEKREIEMKKERVKSQNNFRRSNKFSCYKCGKEGHYAKDCSNKNQINRVDYFNRSETKSVDNRVIYLNGTKTQAIFDTGACSSFISDTLLTKIQEGYQLENCEEKFELMNDEIIKVEKKAYLEIRYKSRKIMEWFYVVRSKREKVLISNKMTRRLKDEEEERSDKIVCVIDTGNKGPVSWDRPIRSKKDREDFEKIVEDLERRGIITQSHSRWLNPVVLVRKKSGDLRFTVDFRRLNDLVEKDNFNLPKIEELIMSLRDAKYFTILDLKDGFYHVPIVKEDQEKTTFSSGRGFYKFTKLPQGFKNSPSIFQRYMITVFKGLVGKVCHIYMDDILVFGKSKEELQTNVKLIEKRMNEHGIKENTDKRVNCTKKVKFLGYEISMNQVRPSLERGEGITNYREPRNRKELQRFIGMVNYDRMFLKNITETMHPLYDLLQKEKKYIWTEDHARAFSKVKEYWKEMLSLTLPDFEADFHLECDASDIGLGAVLRQNGRPIIYISRALKGSEKMYGITEKELLAMIWAMEKLEHYLIGRKFTLYSDHQALTYLNKKLDFGSSRIKRWYERLSRFTFEVKYRPGKEVVTSDALSRSVGTIEELRNIIQKTHEEFSHRKNIKTTLESRGYWVKESDIQEALKDCKVCQKYDPVKQKGCSPIIVSEPGEIVGIDMLEIHKKCRIIVLIDYFTRHIVAKRVTSKNSEKIVKFLEQAYQKYPFKKIICDNGKEFANRKVREFCHKKQIELQYSIPYYHKGNGRIERANRTLRTALRKSKGKLVRSLSKVVDKYNNTVHRGIGMCPLDAIKPENHEKVRLHGIKYATEYTEITKKPNLKLGDQVWIRNETKSDKMSPEYREYGQIIKVLENGGFLVRDKKGKRLTRHWSQLKKTCGEGSWKVVTPIQETMAPTDMVSCD